MSSTNFGSIVRRISRQYSSLQAALLVLVIYDVGEFFHNGRGYIVIKYISRTSAVSSTNFRSILIFASCVVGTCNILYG